ncbi:hypothetical protein LAZ67_23000426 [Cordylochernes scorpioides]|uniref:Uncharacterized protein n=1 Tax=Cordylochernes scorpioides TaxID=51811 RepID=A0ABY6LTW9_9ARAC|nr:hypothetical protein LAZ67_23000426 [Cordylochernes scorpioides]
MGVLRQEGHILKNIELVFLFVLIFQRYRAVLEINERTLYMAIVKQKFSPIELFNVGVSMFAFELLPGMFELFLFRAEGGVFSLVLPLELFGMGFICVDVIIRGHPHVFVLFHHLIDLIIIIILHHLAELPLLRRGLLLVQLGIKFLLQIFFIIRAKDIIVFKCLSQLLLIVLIKFWRVSGVLDGLLKLLLELVDCGVGGPGQTQLLHLLPVFCIGKPGVPGHGLVRPSHIGPVVPAPLGWLLLWGLFLILHHNTSHLLERNERLLFFPYPLIILDVRVILRAIVLLLHVGSGVRQKVGVVDLQAGDQEQQTRHVVVGREWVDWTNTHMEDALDKGMQPRGHVVLLEGAVEQIEEDPEVWGVVHVGVQQLVVEGGVEACLDPCSKLHLMDLLEECLNVFLGHAATPLGIGEGSAALFLLAEHVEEAEVGVEHPGGQLGVPRLEHYLVEEAHGAVLGPLRHVGAKEKPLHLLHHHQLHVWVALEDPGHVEGCFGAYLPDRISQFVGELGEDKLTPHIKDDGFTRNLQYPDEKVNDSYWSEYRNLTHLLLFWRMSQKVSQQTCRVFLHLLHTAHGHFLQVGQELDVGVANAVLHVPQESRGLAHRLGGQGSLRHTDPTAEVFQVAITDVTRVIKTKGDMCMTEVTCFAANTSFKFILGAVYIHPGASMQDIAMLLWQGLGPYIHNSQYVPPFVQVDSSIPILLCGDFNKNIEGEKMGLTSVGGKLLVVEIRYLSHFMGLHRPLCSLDTPITRDINTRGDKKEEEEEGEKTTPLSIKCLTNPVSSQHILDCIGSNRREFTLNSKVVSKSHMLYRHNTTMLASFSRVECRGDESTPGPPRH